MKPSSMAVSFRLLMIAHHFDDGRWRASSAVRTRLRARMQRAFTDAHNGLLLPDEEAVLAVMFATMQGVVRG